MQTISFIGGSHFSKFSLLLTIGKLLLIWPGIYKWVIQQCTALTNAVLTHAPNILEAEPAMPNNLHP